jgi:hypothetical protein
VKVVVATARRGVTTDHSDGGDGGGGGVGGLGVRVGQEGGQTPRHSQTQHVLTAREVF